MALVGAAIGRKRYSSWSLQVVVMMGTLLSIDDMRLNSRGKERLDSRRHGIPHGSPGPSAGRLSVAKG